MDVPINSKRSKNARLSAATAASVLRDFRELARVLDAALASGQSDDQAREHIQNARIATGRGIILSEKLVEGLSADL